MATPGTHDQTCFVVMPFGKRRVPDVKGGRRIDFDFVYDEIFAPAIEKVSLPEGGKLEPHRTDRDFFSADISQDMFEYLEYSRLVLADITGLNANVFYEIGVRHRARESGTVLFRQTSVAIPFDVNQIKAFPYEYKPEPSAREARKRIARVLTETLQRNRIDSPVRRALLVQKAAGGEVGHALQRAENYIRNQDPHAAAQVYSEAVEGVRRGAPRDPRAAALTQFKLGLFLKEQGQWQQAVDAFSQVVEQLPKYGEAHRELGIARNKLHKGMAGAEDLERAIQLNRDDFDALSSLGGIYKRAGQDANAGSHARKLFEKSAALYRKAVEISNGNPYPLLNAIKLEARLAGKLEIGRADWKLLDRAERGLLAQTRIEPPANAPWSFFDLAEIQLYCGRSKAFLSTLDKGLRWSTADWHPATLRSSLRLLPDGVDLPGLVEATKRIEAAAAGLAQRQS